MRPADSPAPSTSRGRRRVSVRRASAGAPGLRRSANEGMSCRLCAIASPRSSMSPTAFSISRRRSRSSRSTRTRVLRISRSDDAARCHAAALEFLELRLGLFRRGVGRERVVDRRDDAFACDQGGADGDHDGALRGLTDGGHGVAARRRGGVVRRGRCLAGAFGACASPRGRFRCGSFGRATGFGCRGFGGFGFRGFRGCCGH